MSKKNRLKRQATPKPTPAPTVYARAAELHRAGRLSEAAPLYAQVLADDPDCVPALQVCAVVAFQAGDFERSESLFRSVLRVEPRNAEAYNNLGNVLRRTGWIGEAIRAFQAAVELDPSLPNAHANLGSALVCRGKLKDAVAHLRRAIELQPELAQAWLDLVSPLAFLGRFDDAAAAFRRAAELDAGFVGTRAADVYAHLGSAFATFGFEEEAVSCLERSMEFRPTDGGRTARLTQGYNALGLTCQHNGSLADALRWFGKAQALEPDCPTSFSNAFWCMQYDSNCDPAAAAAMAVEWAERFAPHSLAHAPHPTPLDGRRLRVGYLSPEFRDHPIAYCIEAMLESHDRERFEIFLYASTAECDAVSSRLERHADHWRNLCDLSDDDAAEVIRADRIDVLVDLAGHTENNRIGVFARKPAPVQAEWLGYYATTGLRQIDYFICNPYLIPPSEEHLFVERPMRLAGRAFSFKPPSEPIPVPALPARSRGFVTFGCHNYLAKVTPEVVSVWAEVLRAVPGSKFVMNRHAFVHPAVRDRYAKLFAACGIGEDRIVLVSTSSRAEYLESLGELDILLDTFPFNGATSIYEALWMGLPVVTMSAPRMVGHFGESILEPLGHPEWVARSVPEYVAKAVSLASDPERLAEIRGGLREAFVSSPLCDAPAFTREMEDALLGMHTEALARARHPISA